MLILFSFQVVRDIITMGQFNMGSLSQKYDTLKLDIRDDEVPDSLCVRVDKVSSQWTAATKLLPPVSKRDSDSFQQG